MEDSLGSIWVGTYDGGIGWLKDGRWVTFNKQRGLFDNGAFQILEDDLRRFWISSNRGIYRVDREQLAAVASGKERLVASIAYGRAEGMLNVECNGGLWPAGTKDNQGALWFPTQMDLAIIDPRDVRSDDQPPRVAVDVIAVDREQQKASPAVTIEPHQSNLEISYTALSYSKPEQTSFQYQL